VLDDPGGGVTGFSRVAVSSDGRLDADRADSISRTGDAIGERVAALAEAGVAHLTCFIGDPTEDHEFPALTSGALERFVPVIERLRGRGVLAPGPVEPSG
jgi:hypothetical protein